MKYFNLVYIVLILLSLILMSSQSPAKAQNNKKQRSTTLRPNLSGRSPLM
uniref:2.5 kDa salivary protein n=1 Tax=Phlebotomus duboscqi TaxID=37738 RepID=Q06K38_PHLDU|nr:2.5 kDa salivary protein [Phlebotomus duboscqi]